MSAAAGGPMGMNGAPGGQGGFRRGGKFILFFINS